MKNALVRFSDEEVSMLFDLYWLIVHKESSHEPFSGKANVKGDLRVPDATEYFNDVMEFITGDDDAIAGSIKNAIPTLTPIRTRYRQSQAALAKKA